MMNMKHCFLCMLAALTMMSCVKLNVKMDSSPEAAMTFQVDPFEVIELSGSPTVRFVQSDSVSVRAEGPKDQLDRLRLSSSKGRLVIEPRDKLIDLGSNGIGHVVIYITSPDLIGVALSGSGDFECQGLLDTDTLQLALRGSGDITFESLVCDYVKAEVLGSGEIELKRAETQWAYLSLVGSGEVEAALKNTRRADILLKGSGDMTVNFDNCRQAHCDMSGSGDVELSGSLERLTQQVSGSGDLDTKRLRYGN